jgi:hypothetical protein
MYPTPHAATACNTNHDSMRTHLDVYEKALNAGRVLVAMSSSCVQTRVSLRRKQVTKLGPYFRSLLRFHRIRWGWCLACVDGTEAAASSACVAQKHDSGCAGLAIPALSNVRALRFFTHCC